MYTQPNSERSHLVLLGRRNVGKSSLVNAITGQELAIVSNVPGTTTDPVKKAMELLPFGPVVFVDTAGLDDNSNLGAMRIAKTKKEIATADFAILVLEAFQNLSPHEYEIIEHLKKISLPFIVAVNKCDADVSDILLRELQGMNLPFIKVSTITQEGIIELKEKIISLLPPESEMNIVADLLEPGQTIVLVIPIDRGAPKGRIILPQVQTMREALDNGCVALILRETELEEGLKKLSHPPALVVTDSQAIMKVAPLVPLNVKVTTFSILQARYKGDLRFFLNALHVIENLQEGDRILIAEACTHHAQADDIGRKKLPVWLQKYSGKNLIFDHQSGKDFKGDLTNYKLIIHCGGCMLTRKMMQHRIKEAQLYEIPMINYGLLISYLHDAFPRVIEAFEELHDEWMKVAH